MAGCPIVPSGRGGGFAGLVCVLATPVPIEEPAVPCPRWPTSLGAIPPQNPFWPTVGPRPHVPGANGHLRGGWV